MDEDVALPNEPPPQDARPRNRGRGRTDGQARGFEIVAEYERRHRDEAAIGSCVGNNAEKPNDGSGD